MKVFISHAYTDQPLVKKVAAALESVGLEVWDATRDVSRGDSWPDKVAQALNDSDAMVVVLTADALRSSWVLKEIEFALSEQSYRGRLIPVLVRDPEALHKEDIPWILRRLRMINMGEYDEEEEGINQIVKTLLENDVTNPPSTPASIN